MFVGVIKGDVIIDVRLEFFFSFMLIFDNWFLFNDKWDILFCFVFRRFFLMFWGIWVLRIDVVFMIVIFFLGLKKDEFCVLIRFRSLNLRENFLIGFYNCWSIRGFFLLLIILVYFVIYLLVFFFVLLIFFVFFVKYLMIL